MATATKKATKKAPAKRSTAKSTTAKRTTAKKTTKKTTARKRAPKRTPLLEREPRVIAEEAGYAAAGIVVDVVEFAQGLPGRVDALRADVVKAADEAPSRVKDLRTDVPSKVESTFTSLRDRITKDAERYLKNFEKAFDAKAAEGRKLAEDVRKDERVAKVLDQTGNTRSQLKAALTSVTKTADVAVEAAAKQAEDIKTQAKATAGTARSGADATASQAKGVVTAARKTVDAAADAATKQAENAKRQVKAAATSTRKSVETVADAAAE